MISEHQNKVQAEQHEMIMVKERNPEYKRPLDEKERQLNEKEQEIERLQTQLETNGRFTKST